MSPLQRQLVQATWDCVQPMADVAVELFHSELLRQDPSLSDYSDEGLATQKRLLAPTIGILVRGLDDLPSFLAAMRQLGCSRLCAAHHMRFASPETVRAAMHHTLRQILGELYTAETRAAWDAVLDLVRFAARDDRAAAA